MPFVVDVVDDDDDSSCILIELFHYNKSTLDGNVIRAGSHPMLYLALFFSEYYYSELCVIVLMFVFVVVVVVPFIISIIIILIIIIRIARSSTITTTTTTTSRVTIISSLQQWYCEAIFWFHAINTVGEIPKCCRNSFEGEATAGGNIVSYQPLRPLALCWGGRRRVHTY